jgi:hypothetical protein
MTTFPMISASTIAIGFVLHLAGVGVRSMARFAVQMREILAAAVPPVPSTIAPSPWTKITSDTIWEANEGLLDSELTSENPTQTWLNRYLTPPSE